MENPTNGVNYINFGGEKRPIKFGTLQGRLYCVVAGCSMGEYLARVNRISGTMEKMDGTEIPHLMMSALMAGHYTAELEGEPHFTFNKVCDWIDDASQEEMSRIWKIMATQNSPNENGVKTPPEKKSPQPITI
jgi:hypothetical protein